MQHTSNASDFPSRRNGWMFGAAASAWAMASAFTDAVTVTVIDHPGNLLEQVRRAPILAGRRAPILSCRPLCEKVIYIYTSARETF
jgi:hypothetical protein